MVSCAIFPEDHKSKVHWSRESLNFEPLVFNSSFLTHWLWVIYNGQSLGKSHCLLTDVLTMILSRSSNGKVKLVLLPNFPVLLCVKIVQIRSFFYSLNLRIQSECGKIRTRKNSVLGYFSHSAGLSENVVRIFIHWIILGKFHFMLLSFLCQQRLHLFFFFFLKDVWRKIVASLNLMQFLPPVNQHDSVKLVWLQKQWSFSSKFS